MFFEVCHANFHQFIYVAMRKLTSFGLASGAMLLLAAGLIGQAKAQDAVPLTAKVIRLTGVARCSVDGQPWQNLKLGDVLKTGSLVQTAKNKATIDIQLGEGAGKDANAVRLFDDTAVEFKKLAATGAGAARMEELELDLRAGQILGVVKKFKDGSSYQIMLPAGAAGIRGEVTDSKGTVYVLKPSGVLTVLAGKVAIAIATENTVAQIVTADQQFDPATGQVTKLASDAPERKLWR